MSKIPTIPQSCPDPGPSPTPTRTIERWDTFIGDVASGMSLEDARKKSYVTRADIETMMRLNDGGLQKQRFEDARLAGMKSSWSVFDVEDLFALIAGGMSVNDAYLKVRGAACTGAFYHMLNADPDMYARFKKAKEAAMLQMAEDVITHADDDSNDVLETAKGPVPNMANVGRSKLKVETRLRTMSSYHTKLFGERKDNVNVQVNVNHAERLEGARARASQKDKPVAKQKLAQAIDATFTEATPVPDNDTSWIDTPPVDTIWREEE